MLRISASVFILRSLVLLWSDDTGASMTEYAMLLGLLTLGVMGGVSALNGGIRSVFQDTGTALASMSGGG